MLAWASAREWPLTARRRIATGAGAVSEPKSGVEMQAPPRRLGSFEGPRQPLSN